MTLAPSSFAGGAQQFAGVWAQHGSPSCAWRWQASPSAFAPALVSVCSTQGRSGCLCFLYQLLCCQCHDSLCEGKLTWT